MYNAQSPSNFQLVFVCLASLWIYVLLFFVPCLNMWFLTVFMSLLQDKRKTDVLNETKLLHQRIDERNWGDAVQDMIRMLKIVKVYDFSE